MRELFGKYSHYLIVCGCWTIVQAILFYQYGIETDFEARKYIEQADHLISDGTLSSPNFWLYSVEIFLIAAVKKLQANYMWVVFVHWVFSLGATIYFYRFTSRFAGPRPGLFIALLLVFTFPLQTFNSFLQTESLFYSFTILLSCYLWQLNKLTWASAGWIFLALVIIGFTRPTGLLWFPCTILYLFARFFRRFGWLFKVSITFITGGLFLVLMNSALGSGGELDFMLPFRDERIICGVPTLDHFVSIRTSANPNSIYGLIYYVTHNFPQFCRLAWLRTEAFFGLYRSYYSKGHNIYLGLFFFPLYLFALLSLRHWLRNHKSLLLYCSSLILAVWGTAILTCDDWHNRFFLSIVPYIYVLVIPALRALTKQLMPNATKQRL